MKRIIILFISLIVSILIVTPVYATKYYKICASNIGNSGMGVWRSEIQGNQTSFFKTDLTNVKLRTDEITCTNSEPVRLIGPIQGWIRVYSLFRKLSFNEHVEIPKDAVDKISDGSTVVVLYKNFVVSKVNGRCLLSHIFLLAGEVNYAITDDKYSPLPDYSWHKKHFNGGCVSPD